MSVDLGKCKVGDKARRRDGGEVSITRIDMSYVFPIKCDDGYTRCLNGLEWLSHGQTGRDIVSIVKPEKRKVALFDVYKSGFSTSHDVCAVTQINGFSCEKWYERKKDAIRGARRFYAAIGYECVIKED